MDWLNYHHLFYFWNVAREGSVVKACEKLHLAQPTISGQIRALEKAMNEKLFMRSGRNLVLTDMGRTVFRYADEIFTIGKELTDALNRQPSDRPFRLMVGITDVMPKLVAYRILERVYDLPEPVQIICQEGKADRLLADLSVHALDLVLTDAPINPTVRVKAYNHQLGECGVSFYAAPNLARSLKGTFPKCLHRAPFLLSTDNTLLRRSLDQWFETNGILPHVVGEFEDSALMKVFGQSGRGVFAAPDAIRLEIEKQYGVVHIGQAVGVTERFYAISVERRLKHPAIAAVVKRARTELFHNKNV
ncbi:MAG: LysR family transcriptional activator of nhaA [Candidatus Latescibacterota bacterium]|jgi:LysR family transcriptional activator of nhaA